MTESLHLVLTTWTRTAWHSLIPLAYTDFQYSMEMPRHALTTGNDRYRKLMRWLLTKVTEMTARSIRRDPRRDRDVDSRDREVGKFFMDETKTRPCYVSRPRAQPCLWLSKPLVSNSSLTKFTSSIIVYLSIVFLPLLTFLLHLLRLTFHQWTDFDGVNTTWRERSSSF